MLAGMVLALVLKAGSRGGGADGGDNTTAPTPSADAMQCWGLLTSVSETAHLSCIWKKRSRSAAEVVSRSVVSARYVSSGFGWNGGSSTRGANSTHYP